MQPNEPKEASHQRLVVAYVIGLAIFVTILGLVVMGGLGNIFWGF